MPLPARIRAVQFDRAIVTTVLMRSWGIVAGLLMVIVTSTLFSPAKQGYYYTFNSLIALQAFFELGLNYVMIQLVSHDAAHLAADSDPVERQAAIDRIALLWQGVRRWFAVSGVLFAIGIGIGGLFFLERGDGVARWEWAGAWLLIAVPASFNLYFSPQLSIAEGLGRVADIARLRLFQSMAGYVACWIVLAISPTLWALACISTTVAITSGWWLRRRSGLAELAASQSAMPVGHSFRHDILPLQWRIGLSWMSGYLLYQIFTPMVFAHQGAVQAARIGLSIAMFGNIALVSMSWLSATTPRLAGMLARGEIAPLKRQFTRLTLQSLAFQCLGCIGLCGTVWAGRYIGIGIMERFLPIADLAVLGVTSTANVTIFALATYMRIHKEEPMMWNSLICGLLVAGGAFFASFTSVALVVLIYMAVIIFVSLPWAAFLFVRYWRRNNIITAA